MSPARLALLGAIPLALALGAALGLTLAGGEASPEPSTLRFASAPAPPTVGGAGAAGEGGELPPASGGATAADTAPARRAPAKSPGLAPPARAALPETALAEDPSDAPPTRTPARLLGLLASERDPLVVAVLAEELGARAAELTLAEQRRLIELARSEALSAPRAGALVVLGRLPATPETLELLSLACEPHNPRLLRLAGIGALGDLILEQPEHAEAARDKLQASLAKEHDPLCRGAAELALRAAEETAALFEGLPTSGRRH